MHSAHYQHLHNFNEDLETHSALSSGSHSAFSEGDIYHYPQTLYINQVGPYGQGYYYGGMKSAYGMTPNTQYSNSNHAQFS